MPDLAQMPRRETHLPYRAGIDGLRAVAVIAVLLYHAEVGWMPGGFLGVEVFLVISGYLITALLLTERSTTGSIGLARFWLRRARRLLPALFALLGIGIILASFFLRDELAGLRGDAAASFGYVTNWYLIFSDQSYFESFGRPSIFQHLWSLALEEQFYLFWPLVFAGGIKLFGRRHLLWGAVAGAIASTALMWVLFEPGSDPSRVYYGTDTRAAGLLIGVVLAFIWHPAKLSKKVGPRAPLLLDVAGVVALLLLVRQFMVVSEFDSSLYRGGFARLSLLTAVVIAAAAHPAARFGRVLGMRPMKWVGVRSYSLYLWHWPVFVVTRPHQDINLDGVPLLALRFALAFALAALSYRYIEQPFRTGAARQAWVRVRYGIADRDRHLRQRLVMFGGVAAAVALFAGISLSAAERPPDPELIVSASGVDGTVVIDPAALDGDIGSDAADESAANVDPVDAAVLLAAHNQAAAAAGDGASGDVEPGLAPTPEQPPGPRVIFIGDSVMLGASEALRTTFGPDVIVDAVVSRPFDDGIWSARYHREVGSLPDTVVVHLGNNDLFTDEQFDELMDALSDVPRVIFLTVRVTQRWEGPVNEALAAGAARHTNAFLADWRGITEGQWNLFAEDLTHLNPEGAAVYAQFIAAQIGV
jgi:peptidoglycan/LPS O-acetylase OafA/YrhL